MYTKYLNSNDQRDQRSIDLLKNAVRSDRGWLSESDRISAMFNYAHIMLLQGDFSESEKYYLKVLKEIRDNAEYESVTNTIYFHLGSMYAWSGKSDRAEPLLQRSIIVNPMNFWAYINLGISHYWRDTSQIGLVRWYFDRGLEISGDSREAWGAVIRFWVDRNRNVEKDIYCQRAMLREIELPDCIQ